MSRAFNTASLVAVFVSLSFIPTAKAVDGIKGIVRSKSGEPIPKVWVHCGGNCDTETDERGEFTLADRGKVIFLRYDGYQPVVLISSQLSDKVEITMEGAKEAGVSIPSCGQSSAQFEFGGFKLSIPKDAKLKKGRDIDYVEFWLAHTSGKKIYYLQGIEGPSATYGFPIEDWVISSTDFSVASWGNGLFDFRGRKADGTFWRYVGRFGFCFSYENTSKAASDFFDKIIDGACRSR